MEVLKDCYSRLVVTARAPLQGSCFPCSDSANSNQQNPQVYSSNPNTSTQTERTRTRLRTATQISSTFTPPFQVTHRHTTTMANPYANPYITAPTTSYAGYAPSTSTYVGAGPVFPPSYGTPTQVPCSYLLSTPIRPPTHAFYPTDTGTSDSYSAYDSPADPNQRMDLIAHDSYRASFDASMAEQSSIYTPEAAKKGGYKNALGPGGARTTVLRKGGGTQWEDQSLMEWDPSESPPFFGDGQGADGWCWCFAAHFRLFIGDLDPALSDDLFAQSFSGVRYPSFVKAKIIRDKYTNKGKGFGFVSYKDPEDFLKAWKEMNGASLPPLPSPPQAATDVRSPRRQIRRYSTRQDLESDYRRLGRQHWEPQGP